MRPGARDEPVMNPHDIGIVRCGSRVHLEDLRALRERGLAIPHNYSSWPLHCTIGSWRWCRVTAPDGRLISGFAVHLTPSRAVPGTRIGQIDRLGRKLHEELAQQMGTVLNEVARRILCLLRLDVRVFDEDPARRAQLCQSLRNAGWTCDERHRQYSHTLMLKLAPSESEVLRGFSTRVRSTIKKALRSPELRFAPVVGRGYANRVRHLYSLAFARTGGVPPPIDIDGILQDSSNGESSLLIGAFAREGRPPEDLVALAWARLHGDHAVLEINASERSPLFNHLSPGFGLMLHLIDWAIEHDAQWIDLGGLSSTHPAASDPMRGIVEFKMRFSSDFRDVAEEWHIDPNPLLAAAASMARSIARTVCGLR